MARLGSEEDGVKLVLGKFAEGKICNSSLLVRKIAHSRCHIPHRKPHKRRTGLEVNLAHDTQRHGKESKRASLDGL